MPEQSVQEREAHPASVTSRDGIALVVGDSPPERLEGAFDLLGLELERFADIEALLGAAEARSFATVLVWAADTGPSLPRAIESLRRELDPTTIVVLCQSIKGWEVHCALAAGARGIVLEEDLERALGPSLEAMAAGQVCVPRSHWRQVEAPALSTREKQILGLVVMGYMNSQIAEQLFLAESTVKSHLSSAFAKLGVRSRHEAVSLIVDPQRGLGMGILGLGGERIELGSTERS